MTESFIFEAQRRDMAKVARKMFERKLTNVAGGNISQKITASKDIAYGHVKLKKGHDYMIMTPTFMSEAWFGELEASQILVVDLETGEQLDGSGRLTREVNLHQEAYQANKNIKVVYHSHALNSMFWATIGKDMPNVTEATSNDLALGEIKCLPYRPACSKELADMVHENLIALGDKAANNIFLLNSHGVLITTDDLHHATCILETVEWNAEIAYKEAVFQGLELLNGYHSKGKIIEN
ncbi:class II aldolase/adducin family protein [Ligilactobacillus apodemi]|uniref:Aldolase n=1 Tax=Ligilactobacillus apodemi DSM 16634 = JCM 16172 TaxID=1423724 RepID=A0A0R1TQV7_9LACO|nr:class II aldolase/adducin family protein [Ligilactobacillus apodemi]KRL83821.1 aldolase [Ligilactobacillus apodemi DSM 16634 = JCM 16172]